MRERATQCVMVLGIVLLLTASWWMGWALGETLLWIVREVSSRA